MSPKEPFIDFDPTKQILRHVPKPHGFLNIEHGNLSLVLGGIRSRQIELGSRIHTTEQNAGFSEHKPSDAGPP
jgi:hypothetical protein